MAHATRPSSPSDSSAPPPLAHPRPAPSLLKGSSPSPPFHDRSHPRQLLQTASLFVSQALVQRPSGSDDDDDEDDDDDDDDNAANHYHRDLSHLILRDFQPASELPCFSDADMISTAQSRRDADSAPAAKRAVSSRAAFVFTQKWYDQMCLEAVPLKFQVPVHVLHPSFFRISCAFHNSLFPPEASSSPVSAASVPAARHSAEANVLYQALAFLQENLNQLFDIITEYLEDEDHSIGDDVLVQMRSNWKHLRGTVEMLHCRYDLLCGYRLCDRRQTALMEAHMNLPLGASALAHAVHHDVRGGATAAEEEGDDASAKANGARKSNTVYDDEYKWNSSSSKQREEEQEQEDGDDDDDVECSEEGNTDAPLAAEHTPSRASGKKKNRKVTWADQPEATPEFVVVLRRYDMIRARVVRTAWHVVQGIRWRLVIYPSKEKGFYSHMWCYLQCGGPVELLGEDAECADVGGEDDEDGAEREHEREEEEEEDDDDDDDDDGEGDEGDEGEDGTSHTVEPVLWCRPTQFELRVVHATAPLARAAVRSGLDVLHSVESVEKSKWWDPSEPESAYPDLRRTEYHAFRNTADDWGFTVARYCDLQPGLYADNDMNVVFAIELTYMTFEQPLPRRDSAA